MLAVILKILSILGIILLILLGVIICILLLVLFMPIVYKVDAEKSIEEIKANVRIRWLFGFLRARYSYPDPGKIIVKFLCFTVFDSEKSSVQKNKATIDSETDTADPEQTSKAIPSNKNPENGTVSNGTPQEQQIPTTEDNPEENRKQTLSEKLFAKYEKIKYTIKKICDKIKHILENISFYKKLLQDEQTKLLFSHACKRLGRILRHIRPRKMKANVIFGAESPDTTGYAYGIYGMFSPQLGKDVCITPDFTQQILIGTVNASGHITIFTLLINILAVLLDKRLRILIRRLKAHSAKQTKPGT